MEIKDLVLQWAEERDLLNPEYKFQQLAKITEELGELNRAVLKNDLFGITDGLGDVQVTLIILAKQLGLDYNACLNVAYEEIKNRTGKTVNGTFIKNDNK
jgi:NTP pyrophosphatase (non-canonical NTP hydrolase)